MKPFRIVLLLAALALIPVLVTDLQAQNTPAATPTPEITTVSSRTTLIGGRQVGEVFIGDTVVLRINRAAGGYSVGERASVTASRLTSALGQGYTWRNVRVARQHNHFVLMMGDNLIITADRNEARLNNMTPRQLAYTWQGQTQAALRVAPVTVVAGTQEQWPAWTNPSTRIVPIISLGTPGVRLGAAQVTGPSERVRRVESVVQLDLEFQRAARIRVFVPSETLTGLNRVQGVAVSALLQYRLFEF